MRLLKFCVREFKESLQDSFQGSIAVYSGAIGFRRLFLGVIVAFVSFSWLLEFLCCLKHRVSRVYRSRKEAAPFWLTA